jgi:hypothetical protein
MSLMDAAIIVLGTGLVMIIFVAKTNIEKSRQRVKVRVQFKK